MSVNTDLPVLSTSLAHLVAHEAYPGHHTEHSRKEVGLVRRRRWLEETIFLVGTPQCLIAEGLADLGLEVGPRPAARSASSPSHLRPLGIRYDAEVVAAVAEAGEALGAVRGNAAWRLHADGADPEVVVDEVARWALLPRARAAKAVEFLLHPTWRAYITCYVEGLRSVPAVRGRRPDAASPTADLSEQLGARADLVAAPEVTSRRASMSERSRNLPRRSCFSTPGSNERFLEKAPTVPADMSFLDLEDSVAPLEKEAARAKVVEAIRKQSWDDRVLCVRINAWDTEWTYGDVIEVVGNAGERLDEVMLPKVQSAAEVVALDLLLTQVEKTQRPARRPHRDRGPDRDHPRPDQRRGDLRRLAPARDHHLRSGRLRRLHGDAGADRRRADPRVPGRPLPLRVLQDPDGRPGQRPPGHRRPVPEGEGHGRAPRLLPAHPGARLRRQVGPHPRPGRPCSTRCTRPTQEQFDRAWDILDAYQQATEDDRKGAVMFGDEMIDEASRKMATKFVTRGSAPA